MGTLITSKREIVPREKRLKRAGKRCEVLLRWGPWRSATTKIIQQESWDACRQNGRKTCHAWESRSNSRL